MTITKYWYWNQCTLRYKTDILEYHEYWYNDNKEILSPYQFVIIDYLAVPMGTRDEDIIKFLIEFSRLMTIENRIVVYDNEEFIKYLDQTNDALSYDDCNYRLDEVLAVAGFDCIQALSYSYPNKDVYLYTKSRLGIEVFEIIMRYYGYDDDAWYHGIWR